MTSPSILALIPARGGSVRIPGKNLKPLHGHPLLAYTIAAAKASGIFARIFVSSESPQVLDVASAYGAIAWTRPAAYATAESPDIEWVHDLLTHTAEGDCFAILRPTSPFRSAATIQRAWEQFQRSPCDCLRAVEAVSVNPYKCWVLSDCELTPLLPVHDVPPWHSRPSQTLPRVYQQNASLEIAKCSLVRDRLYPSICSGRVWGFVNPRPEGFDINDADDWAFAEMQIASGAWTLPTI